EGKFREDLLYRLDVISIVVPALRDRRQDIPELLEHLLEEVRAKYPQSPVRGFAPDAAQALRRHGWPGNVRELAHTVERAVVLGRAAEVPLEDLREVFERAAAADAPSFQGEIVPIAELERRYAAWAVAQTGGHRGKAAEKLGIDPKTLRKWLE